MSKRKAPGRTFDSPVRTKLKVVTLWANPPPPPIQAAFRPFLELPTEIQIIVWEYALQWEVKIHLWPYMSSVTPLERFGNRIVILGVTIIDPGACFQRLIVIQGADTVEIYPQMSKVLSVCRLSQLLTLQRLRRILFDVDTYLWRYKVVERSPAASKVYVSEMIEQFIEQAKM